MTTPKPCPFCGGNDLKIYEHTNAGYVVCNSCDAYGPAARVAAPVEAWNQRAAIPEPEVILCEFPGCGRPADYEGWYRRRDPFLGTPTGHIVRIAFCEGHKSHPHLCANEPKTILGGQHES